MLREASVKAVRHRLVLFSVAVFTTLMADVVGGVGIGSHEVPFGYGHFND
jgi:ABC-type methionine transport system permease subunit